MESNPHHILFKIIVYGFDQPKLYELGSRVELILKKFSDDLLWLFIGRQGYHFIEIKQSKRFIVGFLHEIEDIVFAGQKAIESANRKPVLIFLLLKGEDVTPQLIFVAHIGPDDVLQLLLWELWHQINYYTFEV